jgi:hypothetical protein
MRLQRYHIQIHYFKDLYMIVLSIQETVIVHIVVE